ncbi:MAG: hypothetical protein OEL19_06845 [Sulfurimonas sp.]|nr:hypothetical protein [Sulfurimonas sp.]
MKINKVLDGIEKLFFSDNDEKKQEKIKEKLLKKIEETKQELKDAPLAEEQENLKEKLSVLKKLLKRV